MLVVKYEGGVKVEVGEGLKIVGRNESSAKCKLFNSSVTMTTNEKCFLSHDLPQLTYWMKF